MVNSMFKDIHINALAAFQCESETLAPFIMLQVLHRLEFVMQEKWQIAPAIQALRIDSCFTPLITRWHHILHEEGLLDFEQGEWQLGDCAPCEMQLDQRIDDGKHRLQHFLDGCSGGGLYADGLHATSETISDVLKTPQMAQTLLFSPLSPTCRLLILEAQQRLTWISATCLLQHAVKDETPAKVSTLRWQSSLQDAGFEIVETPVPTVSSLAEHGQRMFLVRRRTSSDS